MPALIARAQAIDQGLTRYYTGIPCVRGHDAERHVDIGSCVECVKEWRFTRRARSFVKIPKPKGARGHAQRDWNNLTEAEIERWYEQVRNMKPNAQRYKHRPLEELPVIWLAPKPSIFNEKS